MVDAKMARWFAFVNLALVSKARMREASKENRSRVIANWLMNANLLYISNMYVNLSNDN